MTNSHFRKAAGFVLLVFESDAYSRSSHPELFRKKCVLKSFWKFTGKHLHWSLLQGCNFIGETPAMVFSFEFNENLKMPFFKELFWWLRVSHFYSLTKWLSVREQTNKWLWVRILLLSLNPLSASVVFIKKPVIGFAQQINWLVSIWGQHWHLMD